MAEIERRKMLIFIKLRVKVFAALLWKCKSPLQTSQHPTCAYVLMHTYIHIKRYKLMQTDIFLGKAVWRKRDDVKILQEEGYGVFSKRNLKSSTTSSQICEGSVTFPEPQTEAQHSSKPVGLWARETEGWPCWQVVWGKETIFVLHPTLLSFLHF